MPVVDTLSLPSIQMPLQTNPPTVVEEVWVVVASVVASEVLVLAVVAAVLAEDVVASVVLYNEKRERTS